MGYWIKRFFDQEYKGTDEDIRRGQASWRLSRQKGMTGVDLYHNKTLLQLEGLGEYWQSDQYKSNIGGRTAVNLTARRIMKKIEENDLFIQVRTFDNKCSVKFSFIVDEDGYKPVPNEWIGKWYVLEYDVERNSITKYISGDKI